MLSKRFIQAAILAGCVLLVFSACGGSKKPQPAQKETLVVAMTNEPQTLAPYSHSHMYGFTVATLIFETLITKGPNETFLPRLAKEWTQIDPTTFDFKLRDDVTFHDGSKMTAEDVKFSLTQLATSTFNSVIFGAIDGDATRVIDDYTIQIKLKYPYSPLFEALASYRAVIVSKKLYEATTPEAFGRAPVGTGPMKFVQWVSGDRIEFSAYDGYWGEQLPFKNVNARVIVEAASRTIELETGGIDYAFDMSPSDWDRIANGKNTQLVKGVSLQTSTIFMNSSFDLFKDIRVREAMAYALNLDALVQTVYQGTAQVADSFMVPGLLGYKKVGPRPYDPEKAKQLLAEAGYPNGIEFQYYTYENQIYMAVAEVLESMWSQAGIKAHVNIIDLASYTSMNNTGQIPVAYMNPSTAMADPSAALYIWPITRTISLRHGDQKIQDFLDAGAREYDTARRAKVYEDMMDYLYEKCYAIPGAFPEFAYGLNANITGFEFNPSGVPDLTKIRFTN
ncbi:MAG: ABC transporter substrate-binding protein [Spirochaetaceae bacterium]|nr:ABC transporter substrate-binding protein [Spirochaetaceae bacterium]